MVRIPHSVGSSQISVLVNVCGISLYLYVLHGICFFCCDSFQSFPWVTWGAFVHVAIASPCPGFNRGKNAPGGGRGSRSPRIFVLPQNLTAHCDSLHKSPHLRLEKILYMNLSRKKQPDKARQDTCGQNRHFRRKTVSAAHLSIFRSYFLTLR